MTNSQWRWNLVLHFIKKNQNSKYHRAVLSLSTAWLSFALFSTEVRTAKSFNTCALHPFASKNQGWDTFLPTSRSLSPRPLMCMTMPVLLHGIRVVSGIFWWGASLPKWKGWSFKWPCMEGEPWRKLWTEAKTRGIQILWRRLLKTMAILAPPHFVWLWMSNQAIEEKEKAPSSCVKWWLIENGFVDHLPFST